VAAGAEPARRLCLPAALTAAEVGTRSEVKVFGEWVGYEVAAESLYDPMGERMHS
jgi:hypothetical protein